MIYKIECSARSVRRFCGNVLIVRWNKIFAAATTQCANFGNYLFD